MEKKKADAKREAEGVKSEQRAREVAQRKLNRAELEAAQLADQLPELRTAVANARGALGAEQRAATKAAEAGKALQAEMVALVETVAQEKQLVRGGGRRRRKACSIEGEVGHLTGRTRGEVEVGSLTAVHLLHLAHHLETCLPPHAGAAI